MKKRTLWLLLIGNLSMSFTLFMKPFINVPDSIGDFLKGFGVSIVVLAFFSEIRKKGNKHGNNPSEPIHVKP